MGTKLAVYRNEIRRLHEMSDDLCVSVSALLGYIARMKATHAEAMCANAGTGPCPRCASYVEEIVRLRACTDSSGRGTGQGADRALRWAAQALSERDGEVRRLKEELDKRDDTIEWFKAELDKIRQELERRNGRLKRYENATTPGKHGYNEDRAIIRAEELKKFAEENGIEIVENHKIGPPEGHEGVCHQMHVEKTVRQVPPAKSGDGRKSVSTRLNNFWDHARHGTQERPAERQDITAEYRQQRTQDIRKGRPDHAPDR